MTSRDFCYWLQGFFELRATDPSQPATRAIDPDQADLIQRHLALVFKHEIDPSAGPPEHQAELDRIHQGQPKPPPRIGGTGPDGTTVYRC